MKPMSEWTLEDIDKLLGVLTRHGASEFATDDLHVRLGPSAPKGEPPDIELQGRISEKMVGDDGLTKEQAEELYGSSGG